MAELTIGMTYGSALFQAASEIGKKELILEEITQVADILNQEPQFCAFLETPSVSVGEKKEVIGKIFEGKVSKEVLNFLYILADKRRTRHFESAVKAYKGLFDKEEGVSYGKIFSVNALDEERLHKFEEETSKLLKQNVKLENEEDKSLIGGVKILIDGKIIDATVRKRLHDLINNIV